MDSTDCSIGMVNNTDYSVGIVVGMVGGTYCAIVKFDDTDCTVDSTDGMDSAVQRVGRQGLSCGQRSWHRLFFWWSRQYGLFCW